MYLDSQYYDHILHWIYIFKVILLHVFHWVKFINIDLAKTPLTIPITPNIYFVGSQTESLFFLEILVQTYGLFEWSYIVQYLVYILLITYRWYDYSLILVSSSCVQDFGLSIKSTWTLRMSIIICIMFLTKWGPL